MKLKVDIDRFSTLLYRYNAWRKRNKCHLRVFFVTIYYHVYNKNPNMTKIEGIEAILFADMVMHMK